jgi:curved DNA-binding protein
MRNDELYQLLGVNKTANEVEIKKAYRKLARELHPDSNKGNKQAEEKFKKVSAAYAVLSDKKKRTLYDEFGLDGLRDGFDPQMYRKYANRGTGPRGSTWGNSETQEYDLGGFEGFGALEDIFESLFGRKKEAGRRSQGEYDRGGKEVNETKYVLEVDFIEAVVGKEKQIQVNVDGEIKRLLVTLPQGVDSGKVLRLKGQGERKIGGSGNSDLLIEIRVKDDKKYEKIGMDLKKAQKLTIGQAYHGAQVPVETPWGKVNVTIPPKTQSGKVLRLKGQGIRNKKEMGDLYVVVHIQIPTKGTKEEEQLIEKLEKKYEE